MKFFLHLNKIDLNQNIQLDSLQITGQMSSAQQNYWVAVEYTQNQYPVQP